MKNKLIFFIIAFILIPGSWFFSVDILYAENSYGLEETIGADHTLSVLKPTGVDNNISTYAGKIIGSILQFVGVIFFLLIIWGGVKWMLARGNEGEAGKAKDIIIDATIGLILIMSAYAITSFIGNMLTK